MGHTGGIRRLGLGAAALSVTLLAASAGWADNRGHGHDPCDDFSTESPIKHVIILIGILLLCSLASPIFLWLLLRKLAAGTPKPDRTASLMQSMDR